MRESPLKDKSIVLGVTGSIAAYKACEITRLLVKAGARVRVMMTRNAAKLVSPLTFSSLAMTSTVVDEWEEPEKYQIDHISYARSDLILIAPATTNFIGKIASGVSDDFVTTTVCAADCPIVIAPAANTKMLENPVTQGNIRKLKSLGYHFVECGSGGLACGEVGEGRLAEPADVVAFCERVIGQGQDLAGKKTVVTAGPTQEAIDPVRFISNRSSGKMGYEVAHALLARGAECILITGPTSIEPPVGAEVVNVTSAKEMLDAATTHAACADCLVAVAAVSDYTPTGTALEKIKRDKHELLLRLKESPDIVGFIGTGGNRPRLVVAFAAETENLLENAAAKLAAKGVDLILANDVSGDVFGSDENEVVALDTTGNIWESGRVTKREIADWLGEEITRRLGVTAVAHDLRERS